MRWAEHVARKGYRRGAHRGLAGNLRKFGNFEDLGVDGRITFKWIFKKWNTVVDGIDLALDRKKWRALASTIMNLWDP